MVETIKLRMPNEEYWQQQIDAYYASGLTKREYCQKNQIKASQMKYWQGRLKAMRSREASFIPAKVKSESIPLNDRPICTLVLAGGLIQIHDEKALLLILDKWK